MTSSLSSPTSFISSCSQGGKEVLDGRVYHYREDVAYVMPEDDEGTSALIWKNKCSIVGLVLKDVL